LDYHSRRKIGWLLTLYIAAEELYFNIACRNLTSCKRVDDVLLLIRWFRFIELCLPANHFIACGKWICLNSCLVLVSENAYWPIVFPTEEEVTKPLKIVLRGLTESGFELIPIRFDHRKLSYRKFEQQIEVADPDAFCLSR
jgi:hypothetical protein